jgi:hypothetical protein
MLAIDEAAHAAGSLRGRSTGENSPGRRKQQASYAAAIRSSQAAHMGICATFRTGAAAGAFLTERPTVTLTVPIAALLLVLVLSARSRPVEVAQG